MNWITDSPILNFVFAIFITWGLGLLPAYLIRYQFLRKPLRKLIAFPIAFGWTIIHTILILFVGSLMNPELEWEGKVPLSLILVGLISTFILTRKNRIKNSCETCGGKISDKTDKCLNCGKWIYD